MIGWDPATFTSFKSAVETLESGVKNVPVETLEEDVKYVQSPGAFLMDFEHIWDLFLAILLFIMNR